MKTGTTTQREAYSVQARMEDRLLTLKEKGFFSLKVGIAGVIVAAIAIPFSWVVAVMLYLLTAAWCAAWGMAWLIGNGLAKQDAEYVKTLVNIDKLERELDGEEVERTDGLQYVACDCGSRSVRLLVSRGEEARVTKLSGRKLVLVCASCRTMYGMHFVERGR